MIIGLSGPKGCGKDTIYKVIKTLCDCHKIAFADPIRDMTSKILNISDNDIDVFKRTEVTLSFGDKVIKTQGRHIYREIGMCMRSFDCNQFINYVRNTINSDKESLWIITDVRFQNEVDFIHSQNGKIILIEREGYEYDNHPSEQMITQYDYKISNTTISKLTEDLKPILRDILGNI